MNEPRVDDFDVLRSRVRLTGVLTAQTALHVGSSAGGDVGAADLPVQKTVHGYPFIPGSSLKGVVRSTLEGILRAAKNERLRACDPLGDDACAAGGERSGPLKEHCAVCRLFGSHLVASHVRFSDARMLDESGSPPIETRDGVSIDRDLRVAASRRKYDLEVVSPGTSFSLEIFVVNPEPWLMGLLVTGLDQIAEGFTAIGGFTSRGLGRVSIAWNALERVTAAQLLAGKRVEALDVEAALDEYRTALATMAEGGT
ncbi:CRISPR-associated RAMP protein Csx7 [Sorangium sp. So ce296]|uniref:type III CRISPR-associated RAMP protein Csx7 n=1 Tax=Sorangium sp. So ce296 TaxID=3133296 RepID=UPI003F61C262